MKLIEADAKALLAERGFPVPEGMMLRAGEACERTGPGVVKAQIFAGGRGKAGLVEVVGAGEVPAAAERVRAAMRAAGHEPLLLVEDRVAILEEYYIAWRIDDVAQCPELLFSLRGGIHVEAEPEALQRRLVNPLDRQTPQAFIPFFRDLGVPGKLLGPLARIAVELYGAFTASDAELVEINPLALVEGGRLVALDAKMMVDDAAAPRHRGWERLESRRLAALARTPFETVAAERGLVFVELPGDIACFSGGAGLGMMVLDALVDAGFEPANFVDTISGSGAAEFQQLGEAVFDYACRDHVRAILAYFTLTATSLKGLVTGLVQLLEANPPPKPLFLGIHAAGPAVADMSLAEAQALLRSKGYDCSVELAEVTGRLKEAFA